MEKNNKFRKIELAMNHVVYGTEANVSPRTIAGLLVSALLISTIGYTAIGTLLNTTAMTVAGITGTNQTLMLVVGIMAIVGLVIKFVPKGK